MTELEKIEYTKNFIDKLAAGINPLDGTPVPEQDLIRQVRISRCFSYVSGLLQQVIDNGGIHPAPQQARSGSRQPFYLTPEQRQQFSCSEEPLAISYLTQRINAMVNQDVMEPLKHGAITSWLLEVGLLVAVENEQGHLAKVPSPEGLQVGIQTQEQMGQTGPYVRVFYSREAQQFILDHLDEILALQRSYREMRGTPWTRQQEEFMVNLYQQKVPLSEIARALKRSTVSIRARLKRLGLLEDGQPSREPPHN